MKYYFFPAIAILLFPFILTGQQKKIDSVKNVIKISALDSNKVNSLNFLSRQYYLVGNYDSSIISANEAKSLGEKIGFKRGSANALNNLGNDYMLMGKYDDAIKNHLASLAIQTEIGNEQGIASSNNNMGSIYYLQGNYPEALKHYLIALKIYERTQAIPAVKTSLASCYSNAGNIYFRENDFDKALTNYSAALKIRLEINDKHGIGISYGNLGVLYYSEHKYAEALKNYSASLKVKQETGDVQGTASTCGNIGLVYYDQGNFSDALNYFFQSANLADSIGSKEVFANAYTNIGQIYVKQHKADSAIYFFNKSFAIGKEIGNNEILKNCYNGYALADSANGNWQPAFGNYEKYILYRDSLENDANSKKILQAQMNFDFEKREDAEKAEQQRKDDESRIVMWSITGGAVLLLLTTFLFFSRAGLKQKNKFQVLLNEKQKENANAVMETQEQERKRIAEDLHDSLGHLLSTAKLNLQSTEVTENQNVKNSVNLLNQASEEIRNIIFALMPGTLEEQGLVAALHELANKVTGTGRVKVILHVHDVERFVLEKQSQFNIYRIVQEAVNNILKHADATEINIQLVGIDNHLSIMIEDDGKGFDMKEKSSGRGLKNIVTRSLWLKGNINIDSSPGHGTTITTEIPF